MSSVAVKQWKVVSTGLAELPGKRRVAFKRVTPEFVGRPHFVVYDGQVAYVSEDVPLEWVVAVVRHEGAALEYRAAYGTRCRVSAVHDEISDIPREKLRDYFAYRTKQIEEWVRSFGQLPLEQRPNDQYMEEWLLYVGELVQRARSLP